MLFRYLISDPDNDIELLPEDLDQPFLTGPGEEHPFLTLKDYFTALEQFISGSDGTLLQAALEALKLVETGERGGLTEIIIRSEKHGAFFHSALPPSRM